MSGVRVEAELLAELFASRDALVRAVTGGAASGRWEEVLPAFDALLGTLARLERAVGRIPGEA